jgi:hypothetical protein
MDSDDTPFAIDKRPGARSFHDGSGDNLFGGYVHGRACLRANSEQILLPAVWWMVGPEQASRIARILRAQSVRLHNVEAHRLSGHACAPTLKQTTHATHKPRTQFGAQFVTHTHTSMVPPFT